MGLFPPAPGRSLISVISVRARGLPDFAKELVSFTSVSSLDAVYASYSSQDIFEVSTKSDVSSTGLAVSSITRKATFRQPTQLTATVA